MAARPKQLKRTKVDGSNARRRCAGPALDERPDEESLRVAQILMDSPIVQKVPPAERAKLERFAFERVSNSETTQAIFRELQLEQYGITIADVHRYRESLDELIRPIASAQVIAGVLGCLPARHRRRIMIGNQVLLLSKVAKSLSATGDQRMESGELLKLASVLRSAAQSQRRPRGKNGDARRKGKNDLDVFDLEKLARGVRMLYGLTWPPPTRNGA